MPAEHIPIMLDELIRDARPRAGDVVVDCTLGGGGHALALLERISPGGRLIGLDADPIALPRTAARIHDAGFGPPIFAARQLNFARLPELLRLERLDGADIVVADLGISAMQADDAGRGFNYKGVGPLDMRMNPGAGEPASTLIANASEAELAQMLDEFADEPYAGIIAGLLKQPGLTTTHAAERAIRTGLARARPQLTKAQIKASVRRSFQALRIAVNDELAALDALLDALPGGLRAGGRAVFITFHSGEDRRVKKAFQAGKRAGVYAQIAGAVVQASKRETRANRRAAPAKLRWAVRG
ncbi:MAG TPA: 16S rRNA (cytosine(1402)-N(4))-methyltransferase RsmH [Vicinamibacterales bacterium]|nr:16S rRNA (cytosine(1402)-N(4))-methyltransferase RsmH [Vicinamibacterales bacterium]